jgi:hypothetical protein
MIRPAHYAVCNAVGAALCSVGATIDTIVDLLPSSVDGGEQRKRELDQLIVAAHQECERKGALSDTIRLVELEQLPLAYHPSGHKHRVQLTAIGQVDLTKFRQNEQEKSVKKLYLQIEKGVPQDIKPPIQVDLTKRRPVFDDNGIWCIDSIDIEYIAYGAGILGNLFAFFFVKINRDSVTGCGGGGESYHGKLWCLEALREKKCEMRVVPPSFFHSSSDLVVDVGFMGAPTVTHELLPSGHECLLAVNAVEKYLSKKITGVYTGEIGGCNGLMGLIVAATKQVPCIDADGIGRAFPRLDQTLPFIHGCSPTPACLCDVRGETVMCTDGTISTPQELEDTFREECTKRGLIVGVCLPPITGEELQKHAVPYSLSRAWFLGE